MSLLNRSKIKVELEDSVGFLLAFRKNRKLLRWLKICVFRRRHMSRKQVLVHLFNLERLHPLTSLSRRRRNSSAASKIASISTVFLREWVNILIRVRVWRIIYQIWFWGLWWACAWLQCGSDIRYFLATKEMVTAVRQSQVSLFWFASWAHTVLIKYKTRELDDSREPYDRMRTWLADKTAITKMINQLKTVRDFPTASELVQNLWTIGKLNEKYWFTS